MRKFLAILLALTLCGCAAPAPETTVPTTAPVVSVPETTVPETTVPETAAPTEALHSPLYREGLDVQTVLDYFHEIVNQAEYFIGTGRPALVQKWLATLVYRIYGTPTEEDLQVLRDFCDQLNEVDGFPGIREAQEGETENLTISFLDADAFRAEFSDFLQGEDAWGATQYWYYNATNEIHTATIGYRTDTPQSERNSIILEEIVNTLGMSDTEQRPDSIVYQYSNDNLCLSDVDWLLLELLYHPDIDCAMDADMCVKVISDLYY